MTDRFGGIPLQQESQQVAADRFGGVPVTAPQPTPEQEQEMQMRQDDEQEITLTSRLSDAFTGQARATAQTEALPELQESGLLAGESLIKGAAISPVLATTTDPNEIASIITSNFPNVGVTYNKDAKGNVFPILVNNETGAAAAVNKPGVSGMDVVNFLGLAAAFTPAGRAATITGAAGKEALTESALQAAQAGAGGEFDVTDVALSAGLGGAIKGAEKVIGGAYRAARGAIPEDQAQLIRQAEKAGVPVMTSDVIPPQTLAGKMARSTGEKIPFVGTGQARATQQEMRQQAVEGFLEKYQAPSYSEIVESLKAKTKGIKTAAGNIIGDTAEKLDEIGQVPTERTRAAITEAIEELSKPNVRADKAAMDELAQLKELVEMPQTYSTIKENRTIFRDIIDSFGKGERSQLPTRSKALLQKAAAGMSDDMDEFAKANLTPKELASLRRANAVYAQEAQKLKKTKIKNILDKGDVSPENVSTMLFSQKPSEVMALYNSLTTQGKENARSALIYRAYENAAKRAGGITPNSFASELNKIAKNTDVFFRGKDRKQLEGFKRLIEATRRAQDAAVETPTGQQLLGAGAGYAAFTDLGATLGLAGTAGGLARLYESAIVRNALLRLGSVQKGSDAYLKALFEAQAALSAVAQSARSLQEGQETAPER